MFVKQPPSAEARARRVPVAVRVPVRGVRDKKAV